MKTKALAFALIATSSLVALPVQAQSQQDQLDARYDRALAAGYKALFLCSAIANAERNGATRDTQSVLDWELTGVQPPLDTLMADMNYNVIREMGAPISKVEVEWSEDMAPRVAAHRTGKGCSLMPIGYDKPIPVNPPSDLAPTDMVVAAFTDDALIAAADSAFAQVGPRTTAVLVRQGGRLLGERYAEDFGPAVPQRTWSVAKSIAATLIGAAEHRMDTWRNASAGLGAETGDPRATITIDHLMRMASGRYSDTPGNRTDPLYYGGSTVEDTATGWPLVYEPGSVFRYANNDTLMAMRAIAETFDTHPPAEFFAKVGLDHTVAETDWRGDYILSSQVWSTARDLAKLGQLYLDDGVLPSGERVLPKDWVEYVSSPAGPQPEGRGWGYGAGFWLFNNHEGIPADTFFMAGNRGQYVVIVPSRDIVIVRRGEDPTGSGFDIEAFTRDVLAALEE
ncbi:MAG: serine hydrolase [Sphingomonadaceae bacterium]|jgi:CubicO group peptidase (beta-lactamase class C family)